MNEIEGKNITTTQVESGDFYTEPSVVMSQKDFPLCEADFLRIKMPSSRWKSTAVALLLGSVGLLLAPLGKLLQGKIEDKNVPIESWEWYAVLIGMGLSIISFIVGVCVRDERSKVMKDIENHFSESPRTRKISTR